MLLTNDGTTGAEENVLVPPMVCAVVVSTNPVNWDVKATVPVARGNVMVNPPFEMLLIVGAVENTLDPVMVWFRPIVQMVSDVAEDGTLSTPPRSVVIPDKTGLVVNVFSPVMLCALVKSTNPEVVGMSDRVAMTSFCNRVGMDNVNPFDVMPLITGSARKVLTPVMDCAVVRSTYEPSPLPTVMSIVS